MHRREFLTGAAALAAYAQVREAEALTPGQQLLTDLGGAMPPPPNGFVYLLGKDGAYLTGANGAFLYGVAP